MGRPASKRIADENEPTLVYCRKCMKMKKASDFYEATDRYLDSNGKMSICKACVDDIFTRMQYSEHSLEKAILRMCRMLNVKFDEDAIEAMKKQVEGAGNKGKSLSSLFGIYKGKLTAVQKTEIGKRDEEPDFTFHEPSKPVNIEIPEDFPDAEELTRFWGRGLDYEDYVYLERELGEWKKTHKCDNKAEEVLLKFICFKQLDIQKAVIEGRNTSTLMKELQELMKTAAIDPAKANQAMSGKSLDTFGMVIKDIENKEPAEWWNENRKKYIDMDGIGKYFQEFFIRPLKNFLLISKNFDISLDEESELDYNTDEDEDEDNL